MLLQEKKLVLFYKMFEVLIGKIMKNYTNSEAVKIAIEYGCKTVKDFAEFIKSYNEGLRVING
jgi:hypothetical protein